MDRIENQTFEELAIGQAASLVRTFTYKDMDPLADWARDMDPVHMDERLARSELFSRLAAQAMWGETLLATVLAARLPGPGTALASKSLAFHGSIALGDTITVTVKVVGKEEQGRRVVLDCRAINQHGQVVMAGKAEVIAPAEKVARSREVLKEVELLARGSRYRQLVGKTRDLEPIRTAVVHPVDAASLVGAIEAARQSLIVPVLVGPVERIRRAARRADLDLSGYDLITTEHSDEAAARSVALARAGEVEALMKGALHTDDLLRAVVDEARGLRTARRISHVFAIDLPGYPRPLFITDAAINVEPSLDDKRDIVQNAIDLAHVLGIEMPRVAILSAVETVSPKLHSTMDAAALCKMADRGQISGGIVDGPLAFDAAVSAEAAKTKGIVSPVAGRADIFVVPNLDSGNMLAKQLEYLAGAEVAGIVLGARVPIILTSRADKTRARLASCAIAMLLAHHKKARLNPPGKRRC